MGKKGDLSDFEGQILDTAVYEAMYKLSLSLSIGEP